MGKWLALIALLSGCATIDRHAKPPTDWPPLIIVYNKIDPIAVQSKCGGNLWLQYAGCVEYDFCRLSCTVHYFTDLVLEHEEMHCKGYQHHGNTEIADGWNFWKNNNSCGMPVWQSTR